MIFVTVGTHIKGFDRLIKAADEYATISSEKVIIQRGSSPYIPISAQSFQWATSREIESIMIEARVVIAHAGAGTIIQVFQIGKPLIIAPRRRQYGESHNDHQYQLAHALALQRKVVLVMQLTRESLLQAIDQVADLETKTLNNSQLTAALRKQLTLWAEARNIT